MKNPLHQHRWLDVSTNYCPGRLDGTTPEDLYGFTRIYQKCEGCGEYLESVKAGHLKIQGVEETLDYPLMASEPQK